jgi:hypothetical protein
MNAMVYSSVIRLSPYQRERERGREREREREAGAAMVI